MAASWRGAVVRVPAAVFLDSVSGLGVVREVGDAAAMRFIVERAGDSDLPPSGGEKSYIQRFEDVPWLRTTNGNGNFQS